MCIRDSSDAEGGRSGAAAAATGEADSSASSHHIEFGQPRCWTQQLPPHSAAIDLDDSVDDDADDAPSS
eukprot:12248996-Alexandrium_andersonii.AAC.1